MSNYLLGSIIAVIAYVFYVSNFFVHRKWLSVFLKYISLIFVMILGYTLGKNDILVTGIILAIFLAINSVKDYVLYMRPFARKPNRYLDEKIDLIFKLVFFIMLVIEMFGMLANANGYGTLCLMFGSLILMIGNWFGNERTERFYELGRIIFYGLFAYSMNLYSAILCEVALFIITLALILTYDMKKKQN